MNNSITMFIDDMTESEQNDIVQELKELGLSREDIIRGTGGRLCDLEDTIDIRKYI